MKYSTKLSDTIHILIFIALGDDELKQGDARAAVITTDDEIGGRLQEVRLA